LARKQLPSNDNGSVIVSSKYGEHNE